MTMSDSGRVDVGMTDRAFDVVVSRLSIHNQLRRSPDIAGFVWIDSADNDRLASQPALVFFDPSDVTPDISMILLRGTPIVFSVRVDNWHLFDHAAIDHNGSSFTLLKDVPGG
jgi:hypothetical protein